MLTGTIRSASIDVELIQSSARSRQVILSCHGNSTSADMFFPLFELALAREYRLISISLPGHGGSEWCQDVAAYSMRNLARLIADIAKSLDAERLILCGHSLGGHLMTEALPRLPQVRALMLISSPPLSQATLPLTFKPDPTQGSLFAREVDDGQVRAFAGSIVRPERVSPARLEVLIRSIKSTDPEFRPALGGSVAAGEFGDEVQVLREATIPIAVVGGAEDPFIRPEAYAALTAGQLWRGQPFVFPAAGHSPHLETSGDFNQLFAEFVASV